MKDSPVDSVATPKVAIDWYRSTPWWRFASQTIVISWRSTHLLLCAAGLLLTQFWVSGSHWIFDRSSPAPNWTSSSLSTSLMRSSTETPEIVWRHFIDPVLQWLSNPTLTGAAHALASMLGIIAIWSLVGGCLSRRSVVELGTRMTATWTECFKLVVQRWQSIAWSVTMPSGLILLLALLPLGLGWLSNIPFVGMWLAGLLMIPVVFLAIGIGWCAAISLFGFSLSVCSVVTEKGADAYDGISRSAAYTFQRPLTLALCIAVAQFLSMVGGTMLSLVLTTGQGVVEAGFDIGSTTSIKELDSMWGPVLRGIVPLLLTAYGFSFFWTASAASYLILRRDVDQAEYDLIDMGNAEIKPLPELPKRPSLSNSTPSTNTELPENTAE